MTAAATRRQAGSTYWQSLEKSSEYPLLQAFRVSVAPLLEQHEQDGVERTVLGRDRVVDEVDDVLETL